MRGRRGGAEGGFKGCRGNGVGEVLIRAAYARAHAVRWDVGHGSDSVHRGVQPAVLTCALTSGCVACRVVYATGEEETLELEEVIRDQQLTLL